MLVSEAKEPGMNESDPADDDYTTYESRCWTAALTVGVCALVVAVIALLVGCTGFQFDPPTPPYQPQGTGGAYWETPGQAGAAGSEPQPHACRWVPARSRFRNPERELTPRVVNGDKVDSASLYPFTVALETPTRWQYCMGTVLSARRVLTAAHCQVEPGDVVHGGVLDLRHEGVSAVVLQARHHPAWTDTTSGHDVAILVLAEDLPLPAAELAPADYSRTVWTVGCGAMTYGGGTVKELLHAEIPLVDWGTCRMAYGSSLDATMICAGNSVDGDACQGDSGGPLVQDGKVVGGASWGDRCAGVKPGVWTDYSEPGVARWIRECSR